MIQLVEIESLLSHEQLDPSNLKKLLKHIAEDKMIKEPIVVDSSTNVVLDGHHRCGVAQQLGLKRIPVQFVDYCSDNIRVFPRRSNIAVSKEIVIERALKHELFPAKTTRHVVPKVEEVNIELDRLR
ncbi:MAG: ParB N-terminal domain-containing protein [Candidatus Woesearchaeota archaeon]